MVKILFGSTNEGKLRELRRMTSGFELDVVSPGDLPQTLPEVVEDGLTFEENARKKAVAFARSSGLHAVADDSGLCVDVLGGAPGVHSARWSAMDEGLASPACALGGVAVRELGEELSRLSRDEANNDKLLASLRDVADAQRTSRYVAVLVLASPDGSVLGSVEGSCSGRIGRVRRGSGGFGYDPLFVPDSELRRTAGTGADPATPRTMAELSPAEKDAISHRGAAFRALRPALEKLAFDKSRQGG